MLQEILHLLVLELHHEKKALASILNQCCSQEKNVKSHFTINKGYCRRSYTSFIFKPICRVTLHAGLRHAPSLQYAFSPHWLHQRNHQSSTGGSTGAGSLGPTGGTTGSTGAGSLGTRLHRLHRSRFARASRWLHRSRLLRASRWLSEEQAPYGQQVAPQVAPQVPQEQAR